MYEYASLRKPSENGTEKVRKTLQISPNNRNCTEQPERKSLIPNNENADRETFKPLVVGSTPTAPTKLSANVYRVVLNIPQMRFHRKYV